MHLIATIPGGWNPDDDGVFYIEQKPGDIVFLSAGDTEIHTMNEAYKSLHKNEKELPSLRMTNLMYLKQELTIDNYIEDVLEKAKVIVCSLLGGISYYKYLVESLVELQENTECVLLFIPAHEPDYELMNLSSVDIQIVHQCRQYLQQGGNKNAISFLNFLRQRFFNHTVGITALEEVSDLFLYSFEKGMISQESLDDTLDTTKGNAVLLSYRTHYLANNLEPLEVMSKELKKQGLNSFVVFAHNLRDTNILSNLEKLITNSGNRKIHCIVNTTGFTIKPSNNSEFIFDRLGIPVLQAIFSTTNKNVWKEGLFGLPPTDIAMNIALPEIDGRIIGRAVSFKKEIKKDSLTDSTIVKYEAHQPACEFMARLTKNWIGLQQKNNEDKRVAVILPNYPNKDSRLANGVGLDTPESCIVLLDALKKSGYTLGKQLPTSGTELMHWVTQVTTNDVSTTQTRPHAIIYRLEDFQKRFDSISSELKEKITEQWGNQENDPYFTKEGFIVSGFLLGNVFISIQPSRGYNQDPQAIYHSPDLAPTYQYLAYYFWLQDTYQADAVIHLGKHGNLEWLPGKSVSLDPESCFPALLFDALPHFYPFIINDPGEGTQAKRRNQAVIIDHLIPPMTRAETYGSLMKLEHLVDEYYEASNLDPKRSKVLEQEIANLVKETQLNVDLGITSEDVDELLVKLDGYLCELKEAQIRDGLHIFGKAPKNEQLIDLLIALHRMPSYNQKGITQILAEDLNIETNVLSQEYAEKVDITILEKDCKTIGQVVEQLELIAKEELIKYLEEGGSSIEEYPKLNALLSTIQKETLIAVEKTSEEISNLLEGLNGSYVPSGPSGAPTRGRLDLLPTGRNFFSVDVRTIPTETAYRLGEKSAQLIIDRYIQEHGEYPKTIGISVWGTSTMRTGGDDIAQAFALMGVKPIWKNANRRVSDFEVIPLLKLKRPRVDVTIRISGFFRDAFPDVINLFNTAVTRVAQLEESLEENPIRKRYLEESNQWKSKGLSNEEAEQRALYRVFGSKPGAYGAGLQAVIDEKNWNTQEDLAKVYINWSGYAYGNSKKGVSAHESFTNRLEAMQIVMHNQDNREHDILDSDDYYQFQGGLANAVKTVKGEDAAIYFGDHSRPETPRIKTLKEELLKVYRSRVVNPKWIAGVQRHGYKGAFEMAATLDYLFAYDATTNLIDDFMYEGITESYLLNKENKTFIKENNPWALKDMSERLLEAIQRGMWQNPSEEMKQQLEDLYMEGEGIVE
ncbi:cobaltochelatase CobN subunit [Tenacibaculum sp. MAR_2009_124]|uniref:cobaltochelatase subunit CobN n=1 Tax=Tenacibaculum sp. MAR_2009_124 TaxID=1250059 RepID=UPI00089C5B3F|nr:cobaltochelatase subunit CobN [Tenacibaculum sp. MAR_2009_124]SEB86168.1 cobaltochelatase CobN subunit [Tenacibaculum sp. MAR_2009_124]